MKILFCAAEMAPLVKAGGLADVTHALAKALARRGHDVRLVIPCYGSIDKSAYDIRQADISFTIPVLGKEEPATVWTCRTAEGISVYLIEHAQFFGGQDIYTPDDMDRFLYFSKAALKLLKYIDWQPEILHCHDWHAGFAVSHLRNDLKDDPQYSSIASVLTIHNLGYQGWFDYNWAKRAGILEHIPPQENPLHPVLWRTLALGIYYADAVSTVSETYATEILAPAYYSEGLELVLQHVQTKLRGIVNGIDYEEFNPATDVSISANYDCCSLQNKAQNKARLQAELGLAAKPEAPLLGYVGRFTRQKGASVLAQGVGAILAGHDAQFVALGQAPNGEQAFGEIVKELESSHPLRVKVISGFDEALSRRIYAGCDMFLMPSLYEPCGLGQLISMRYGTIPIVRRTGGLVDTVIEHPVAGNGFQFDDMSNGTELAKGVERALSVFGNKEQWSRLIIRAMNNETSWEKACPKYEELYRLAQEAHKGTPA